MDLNGMKAEASRLSPWAHLATVRPTGTPDVVPVHPCWEGDMLWVMCGKDSVKSRNVAHNPNVALHWQVTAVGDGVEMWGTAALHDSIDTKRRLWNVFDYDLNAFAPGGPDNSPDTVFMGITVERALYLAMYGVKGRYAWRAD